MKIKMEKFRKEKSNNVIGEDKMNDEQRRKKFIDECKNLNIDVNIGQKWKNIDDTTYLNLMARISNREREISFIFSRRALSCLIETQTGISEEEHEFIANNGLEFYDGYNIQHWNTLEELIRFVTLLKQYNNP